MSGPSHRGSAAGAVLPAMLVCATALVLTACSPSDDKESRRRAAGPAPSAAALLRVASASAGERVFGQCFACHSIDASAADRSGPNLFGVMGATVGQRRPRFPYTGALQAAGGTWTPARMDVWLTNPKAMVPGTAMGFAGLADPLDRADVIAYLQKQH
jgi:cytochrome c